MAHGTPDWGVTAGAVTVYQLTDLAELAARLGSPITHDRRGDVIWWDDFEWSLNKWGSGTSGTGAAVALDTTRARNGRTSVKLTAGSDGDAKAEIYHDQPVPAFSNLGIEFAFCFESTIGELWLLWDIYTGSRRLNYVVRWRDSDNAFQYRSSDGLTFVTIATVNLSATARLFHVLKVVVDPTGEKYVRVILDDQGYSLAGVAAFGQASVTLGRMAFNIQNFGRAAFNDIVYVDDAILTQNEPV